MNEKREILKKLKVEEDIWFIYLLIIGLSFYSNSVERKYYINNDLEAKEKYRKINILINLFVLHIDFRLQGKFLKYHQNEIFDEV